MAATDNSPDQGDIDAPSTSSAGVPTIQDRIAAFAMLDGMKDGTQAEKTLRLSLVGFKTAEIARLLQTTPATVRQNIYEQRKKAKTKAPTTRAR
jgi:DNA-directed RNA polymerase specialized sigma24 family protein